MRLNGEEVQRQWHMDNRNGRSGKQIKQEVARQQIKDTLVEVSGRASCDGVTDRDFRIRGGAGSVVVAASDGEW